MGKIILKPDEETRVRNLVKITKDILGKAKVSSKPVKQPVVWLIRNNNDIEFHEGQTGNEFAFKHSNKQDVKIQLSRRKMFSLPVGKEKILSYLCHEDIPFCLPQDTEIDIEELTAKTGKILADAISYMKKNEGSKLAPWAEIIKWTFGGIIGIILAEALGFLLIHQSVIGLILKPLTGGAT